MSEQIYSYEIRPLPEAPVEMGELVAKDMDDARRQLRVRYLCPQLPRDTRIVSKAEEETKAARTRSAKLRNLLRVLAAHHAWLRGEHGGERADLSGLDLTDVDLKGTDLTDADLAGADLSGADLRESTLLRTNLRQAILHGVDLRESIMTGADLSEADLRDSDLRGITIESTDFWRANLRGCAIEPKTLHKALGCKMATT